MPSAPHFEQLGPTTWVLTPYAWAHCINCGAELADGERTSCTACQQKLDAIVVPWDEEAG